MESLTAQTVHLTQSAPDAELISLNGHKVSIKWRYKHGFVSDMSHMVLHQLHVQFPGILQYSRGMVGLHQKTDISSIKCNIWLVGRV